MDSSRLLRYARVACVVLIALPTAGIAAATLWQAGVEGGGLTLDRLFHLGSGLAMLVLFAELALTISNARLASRALLVGVGGFVGSLAAALTVELLGPIALIALVILAAAWAILIGIGGSKGIGTWRTSASV